MGARGRRRRRRALFTRLLHTRASLARASGAIRQDHPGAAGAAAVACQARRSSTGAGAGAAAARTRQPALLVGAQVRVPALTARSLLSVLCLGHRRVVHV
jgi:hypothetical protein